MSGMGLQQRIRDRVDEVLINTQQWLDKNELSNEILERYHEYYSPQQIYDSIKNDNRYFIDSTNRKHTYFLPVQ